MTDDDYLTLKKEADDAEAKARAYMKSEMEEIPAAIQWLKCTALRLDMCLRHGEKYNGYPGVDGHESEYDPRDLFGV